MGREKINHRQDQAPPPDAPPTRSQSTPARAHARAMASIELDAGWWCSAACAFRASASLPIVLQLGELSYFQDGAGHVAVETVALSHTLDLCPLTQTTWDALHIILAGWCGGRLFAAGPNRLYEHLGAVRQPERAKAALAGLRGACAAERCSAGGAVAPPRAPPAERPAERHGSSG